MVDGGVTSINGNVMDNIAFGDIGVDGIESITITVEGTTYKASDYPGNQVTINTAVSGTLVFNFATGNYTYSNTDTNFAEDQFTIDVSDANGKETRFDLKISSGQSVVNSGYSETYDSAASVADWSNSDWSSGNGGRMQLTGHGGIKWTSKTFAFGGAAANKDVTLEFDLAFTNGWETSGNAKDFFEVRINGQVASDVSAGTNLSYSGTTNGSGDVTVTFRSITTASDESALIDNLHISLDSPPTSNELFLYGDDNDAEQFVIHSEEDVTLVNYAL